VGVYIRVLAVEHILGQAVEHIPAQEEVLTLDLAVEHIPAQVEVLTLDLVEVLIPAQEEVLTLDLVEVLIMDLAVVATTAQVEVELISGTDLILIVSKQNIKTSHYIDFSANYYDE
jgi:hypothetical protein